jgi:hypothetical protein
MTGVHLMRLLILLSIALSCTACLDRSETEPAGFSSFIYEPGVEVRPLERNMDAKTRLDANDGLTGPKVPLRTGFAAGKEVQYWDLGTSLLTAEPMWIFLQRNGEVSAPADHPPLVDSIPGDTVYSPIRLIFEVVVTSRWAGERFPSLRALDDGVELGLLEAPVAKEAFTNCVVTLKDIELDNGAGGTFKTTEAYYRGKSINQICVGDLQGDSGLFATGKMFAPVFGNAFLVRRETDISPLDESVLKADLNGDGDQADANVVFDSNVGDMSYTSLWKNLDVVVEGEYKFGDAQTQDALFMKEAWGLQAKDPPVIEYKDTGVILNRPLFVGAK